MSENTFENQEFDRLNEWTFLTLRSIYYIMQRSNGFLKAIFSRVTQVKTIFFYRCSFYIYHIFRHHMKFHNIFFLSDSDSQKKYRKN